jgi:hypothetical protein
MHESSLSEDETDVGIKNIDVDCSGLRKEE